MVCFVHFDFEMCFAPQRHALLRQLNFQKCSERDVFLASSLANALRAPTACTFSTSQLPKVVRTWCALYILTWKCASTTACTFSTSQFPKVVRACGVLYVLTWKCASRHNGMQFFISHLEREEKESEESVRTEKIRGRRALFSTSQFPKVVREWCDLYVLTSKCASRHNGVQLFISHLARWLRTRRFSEPTFRRSGAINHWKNRVFRDFPTFWRFLLTLSLL